MANKTYNDFNKMLATKIAIKRDHHESVEESFKVGDLVVALKGVHKGEKHKVIHVFKGSDKYNVKPLGIRNDYRLGAATAKGSELKLVEGIEESDAPQTTVGGVRGGMIGEPPGPTKKKRRKKKYEVFAGSNVFEVSSDVFMNCKGEKGRYDRYVRHVGNDRVGEGIRAYGRENPGKGIIIKDSVRGTMMVLRRGNK